ncbi:hypothetical protein CMO93_05940 [Candidatus Woesearchaeota archaeon]|jgi:transcription initiation factor TFIIIB Brf1 subunit/transcription initiation factor TFIIB|nr:hypothetical protein [Candidatus Woesearchaeota archaeon]|tara:strand:+ start:2091 stop:2291 length:201 start_codon:yes stop_codon:yes gene_type:complete
MNKTCPKCESNNIKIVDYLGTKCIICKNCGFDESKEYEVYPEQKTSQKEKARHTPYKTGGHKRTRK